MGKAYINVPGPGCGSSEPFSGNGNLIKGKLFPIRKGERTSMKIVETAEVAPTCHSNFKLVETAEVAPTCHAGFKLVETAEVAPTCH
jgi:hypothetical protein